MSDKDPNVSDTDIDVDEDLQEEEIIEDLDDEPVAFVDDGKIVDEEEEEEEEVNPFEAEVEQLRQEKKNLNTALHQARDKEKKRKAEAEEETPYYTDEQLKEMWDEADGDRDALFTIMSYRNTRDSKHSMDADKLEQVKAQHDAYMLENWPFMSDEDSEVCQHVQNMKESLQLEDNPIGDYLSLGVSVLEELDDIKQLSYDQGVKDAKSGTVEVEKNRKGKIKSNSLTPSGKKTVVKGSMSASSKEVAKRLGIKPGTSAYKTYQERILKMQKRGK